LQFIYSNPEVFIPQYQSPEVKAVDDVSNVTQAKCSKEEILRECLRSLDTDSVCGELTCPKLMSF